MPKQAAMNCPTCQAPLSAGAKFCANCGAPAPQATTVGSYTEPVPEASNPKAPITLGDMTIRIEGELVPIVDVELGSRQTIYFEHHILLWKQPDVRLGFMGLQNAGKRFFAGLQIFISTAQGPGNIAMSREAPGQIVAMRLAPGQAIDVEPGAWLWKDANVRMDTVTVLQSGGSGGGLMGALGALVGGASLVMNRFVGPGRVGLQSMTYHEPQAEGAQQAGGTSNIGGVINSFFGNRQ